MCKEVINIVWLKRDLRTQNHLPLQMAENASYKYIILFLLEPSIICHHDTSIRHLQFQYQSVLSMQQKLKTAQQTIHICYAEAIEVLEKIQNQFTINALYSYMETGVQLTYNRDINVKGWCKKNNIVWQEVQRDGTIRGIRNRDGWDKQWYTQMCKPIIVNNYATNKKIAWKNEFAIEKNLLTQLQNYNTQMQPPGEDYAMRYLMSFVNDRAKNYSKHISKPALSRFSCSRLSPYLSWGNISIAQVFQTVIQYKNNGLYKFGITNFLSRLKWHCHFIQKMEQACWHETKCINKGYENLGWQRNDKYIKAWKTGLTGYPLVDACMRCLINTGWINFRMRAMLVSFFCHQLLQDWRWGAPYLAQQFLDYEPGIHYPQFQMQAGTTGINTVRMYNPVKQSEDNDADAVFIKKWVPELNEIPITLIHRPWLLTIAEQQMYNLTLGKDYPLPIIDLAEATKTAKELIWGQRKTKKVQEENTKILNKLTRRKTTKETNNLFS